MSLCVVPPEPKVAGSSPAGRTTKNRPDLRRRHHPVPSFVAGDSYPKWANSRQLSPSGWHHRWHAVLATLMVAGCLWAMPAAAQAIKGDPRPQQICNDRGVCRMISSGDLPVRDLSRWSWWIDWIRWLRQQLPPRSA